MKKISLGGVCAMVLMLFAPARSEAQDIETLTNQFNSQLNEVYEHSATLDTIAGLIYQELGQEEPNLGLIDALWYFNTSGQPTYDVTLLNYALRIGDLCNTEAALQQAWTAAIENGDATPAQAAAAADARWGDWNDVIDDIYATGQQIMELAQALDDAEYYNFFADPYVYLMNLSQVLNSAIAARDSAKFYFFVCLAGGFPDGPRAIDAQIGGVSFYQKLGSIGSYYNLLLYIGGLVLDELNSGDPNFGYVDFLWWFNTSSNPPAYLVTLMNYSSDIYELMNIDAALRESWDEILDNDPSQYAFALMDAYDRWQAWIGVVGSIEDIGNQITAIDAAMTAAGYANFFADPETFWMNLMSLYEDAIAARDAAEAYYNSLLNGGGGGGGPEGGGMEPGMGTTTPP